MSKFVEPFSPTIMETKVSEQFIDTVNAVGNDVLSSDTKSIQYDWSHKLVGKVSKEIQIPIPKTCTISLWGSGLYFLLSSLSSYGGKHLKIGN